MTSSSGEQDLDRLSHLAVIHPDEAHSAAVRARCHAALARQRRARERREDAEVVQGWGLEFATFGGMVLLYVVVVVREAIAMYGG